MPLWGRTSLTPFKTNGIFHEVDLSQYGSLYIEPSQDLISKKSCIFFLSRSISSYLDEMPHDVAFHLGLHCLPKYQFRGFQSSKGFASTHYLILCYQGDDKEGKTETKRGRIATNAHVVPKEHMKG